VLGLLADLSAPEVTYSVTGVFDLLGELEELFDKPRA
jgi:hypothetical protein